MRPTNGLQRYCEAEKDGSHAIDAHNTIAKSTNLATTLQPPCTHDALAFATRHGGSCK